ncbi:zinc finger, CCHC-type containing protein, partial [Tanacetum coccineum]
FVGNPLKNGCKFPTEHYRCKFSLHLSVCVVVKSLSDVDSKTRWIKYVPIKVNVHAWKVKTYSLPTRFNVSRRASNWLERLPAGSITTWEDLTTQFLAQFFPPGRTAKLRNDILMFQQHHGESLSEAWTRFKDLLQKVPHHGIDLWLQV